MKFKTLYVITGTMFVAGAALVGCGSNNNNAQTCPTGQSWVNNQCVATTSAYTTGYNNPQCTAGQVSTQYGCLAPVTTNQCGTAPAGQAYALYNGATCVLGTVSTGYNNGYNNGYPNTTYPNTTYPNGGQCAPGSVMTQMNCLPINPQACYGRSDLGYYAGTNTCWQATTTGYNYNYSYPYSGNTSGFYYYYHF